MAFAALLLALLLCTLGALRSHKVYDEPDGDFAEFGIVTFNTIGGLELVVDATFTGTMRKDGKFYSTYDRSAPRGKRACPT